VHISWLSEQGADETRLGLYARRWWRWANASMPLTNLTGLPHGPLVLSVALLRFLHSVSLSQSIT